jgi:O-antigen ligase
MKRGWERSLLIVAVAVLYPFHRGIVGLNVSFGDSVVLLICGLLILKMAASHIVVPRYLLHMTVLVAIIAASMMANTVSPPGLFFTLRLSQIEATKVFAVMAWMVSICWLFSDDFPRRFLVWTVVSVPIATGFSAATVYQNLFQHLERPTGPFENANIYGNFLMLNAFLSIGMSSRRTNARIGESEGQPQARWGLFVLGALPVLTVGMMATGSRGTLLALAVGLVAMVPWRLPRRIGAGQVGIALVSVVVLLVTIVWFLGQHPYLLHRLSRTGSGDPNVTERLTLWRVAWEAFLMHPVFGIGYGQFPGYASSMHHIVAKVTHETYLSYAAELGVPGLVAFLWLLGAVVRDSWRLTRSMGTRTARALFGFLVATAVQGLVNNVDQFRSLWIAVGMVAALELRERAAAARAPTGAGPGWRQPILGLTR